MSESWNPWRDARDNDEATTETATVQRRLPNPAHGSLPEALDFLTILGHAQNLDIDFLPITWFPAIETIGDKGATAEIRQAFIDIKQSYAFKRVVIGRNETFKVLRSEISVLGLANIKRHPNINHLQGICWDIDSDQDSHTIWPVLVFERASGGDLGHFIASKSASNLSIGTALGLLQGIAKGLSCLHANGIIHGDIKPNNILITNDEIGQPTAKIADFGYSTLVNHHKLVIASTTPPWSDPTYDGTPVEFDSAKRLDSFSFGRLCLWMLYSLVFLQGNKAAVPSSMMPQSDDYSLNRANEVLKLIPGLQKSQKTELLHLFNDTLQPDIKLRSSNFRKFADALGADEITLQDSFLISLDENRMIAKPLFRIAKNALQLLIADFRVLRFIYDELRQQFDSSESTVKENAALQLAVCHSIGFGTRKNNIQSQSWLERSGRTKEALQIELNLIREDHRLVTDDLKFRQMDGTLGLLDSRLSMRDAEVIKNAENHYRALIEDLSGVLPETHIMRMQSRYILASVLQKAGNNAEAKQLYSDLAKDMASSRWGPSHQSTIDMHVRSASMSYNMGAYTECEELLRIALAQQVENVPQTHQDVLIIKVALAAVLNDLSKLEEAEGFARSAAEKYLEKLGSSHPQTQGAMGVLANILLTRGKLVEAEKILESTAKTLAEVVGKENAELVTIRSNLALIYARQGRLTAAEKLLEELQQEITNTVGISHPNSIFLLGNLAVTSHDIGKKDRAIVIYQQILQRSDVIGANHPYLLTVKANLASALINDRRYQESAKLLDDALEKQTSIYGRNNTSTLSTMSIQAKLFQAQGNYQAAKELYNIVLKGKEVTLGRNHPSVNETLANLALVVRELGDVSSALKYSRESVNALEAGLGLQHPSTLMATMNLATIMVASGDLLDAISTFSSVLCRAQEILGEAHPDSILAMNHLARTYHLHQEHKKSKECYLLALRLESKIGSDHTRILSVKHNLGLLLYDLGEFHGAEKVFSEAVSGRRKVLGDDHYDTLESSYSLALALHRLRKTATALQLLQGVAYRKEQTLGEGNEETWRSFGSLALMFHDTGHYKHSSDVRIHQLALMSKKLPDNHADILASRQALAESLREQKQFSEAAEILREVVGKRQSLLHQDDPQILATRYSLGLVQFCQCKFQEADTNLCEVLKAYDDQGLTENEGALDVAHTLGMIQHRMGKLEQSQHSFLRAMEGRRKLPGRESRVYESLMCLALVSRDMTQMAKAIAQAEEAWSGIQKYLGPAHHLTTHSLLNLISLFLFEEKIDRAVRAIESYLEAMGEELGWADRRILDMGKKPVLMVFRFGETKRAIKLMKSIHEGYQKELSGIANLVRECEEELRKMESGDSKV